MLVGLFSVPCFANPVLDDVLEEATSGNIEYYSVDNKRAVQISNYIIDASEKTGIDALFIASVVKVDSIFRPSEENFYNSVGLLKMRKNYIAEVANLLGVKIGEIFKISIGNRTGNIYYQLTEEMVFCILIQKTILIGSRAWI